MPASAKSKSAATKPTSNAAPEAAPAAAANPAARPVKKGDHVFLVDGSGYIFRAYHAIRFEPRTPEGVHVNAVYGFCAMLWKLLKEMKPEDKPTHLAVVFDKSEKTFRTEMYKEYKAHRPPPPEDLIPQFALIRDAVRAFEIPCVELAGYEADDLIATYARQACEAGATATIVSSDKDLMQLVNDCTVMYDTMKDVKIGIPQVIEKFGVGPDKVIEVQSLIGDSSDNVPGVPGIGPKTAAELINTYGDLETVLARACEIKQEKRRQSLIDNAELARISKKLVTLDNNVPLTVPIDELGVHEPDYKNLIAFLKSMGFKTLTQRVAENSGIDAAQVEAGAAASPAPAGRGGGQGQLAFDAPAPRTVAHGAPGPIEALTPISLSAKRIDALREAKFDAAQYTTIETLDALKQWIARAQDTGVLALKTETNALDPMQASLCGIAFAVSPNEAAYLPLGHREASDSEASGLFAAKLCDGQVAERDAIAALKAVLEDASITKVGHDVKRDYLVLATRGIRLGVIDDVMLMSYVLDAGKGAHDMSSLSERYFNRSPSRFADVKNKDKALFTPEATPIPRAAAYAAEDADAILRLWSGLKPRMAAEHVVSVYETLERPMPHVLARMEERGIAIDQAVLARLSNDFGKKQVALEQEINTIAGTPVNVGSPKQLGEILFGQMGLPGGSKTKTGQWSTTARELEELAEQGHELPRKILDWRQVSKLRSTYTEALPTYVNPTTKRVHTSYALAATSTGRLSSSEPNLQNIPVRTEDGRKIRKAFVAAPGMKLISADYSQIELRLLAEVAEVPTLRQAFKDGVDIHAMTASEMFGEPIKGMSPETRRRAKAINFGIIYGISAFGLANQLGIERSEAGEYIKKYFERFPGIRDYMDSTRDYCREHGYVLTLFGRKCHYPDIKASNPSIRAFNERAAINARLQGSAADIIRRAMMRMEPALDEAKLKAQMLLQVHDELIFEVPEKEVTDTIGLVREVMEGAPHPAVALNVPLQVDARAADNWDEAH
ncbi:MAG TPA: DNA polymerase I [Pseudolabrys sp.]|uniref:DNA polymerase I n=1 Tax=Pseudolabrys sp. TaxID=1960880 RepID=UPI002DDD5F41|nr:DNA polymerase I [Pseudolabrys sp.]HEV2627104.1 DNA polymerase I [Pseudolabrys sp.]